MRFPSISGIVPREINGVYCTYIIRERIDDFQWREETFSDTFVHYLRLAFTNQAKALFLFTQTRNVLPTQLRHPFDRRSYLSDQFLGSRCRCSCEFR